MFRVPSKTILKIKQENSTKKPYNLLSELSTEKNLKEDLKSCQNMTTCNTKEEPRNLANKIKINYCSSTVCIMLSLKAKQKGLFNVMVQKNKRCCL